MKKQPRAIAVAKGRGITASRVIAESATIPFSPHRMPTVEDIYPELRPPPPPEPEKVLIEKEYLEKLEHRLSLAHRREQKEHEKTMKTVAIGAAALVGVWYFLLRPNEVKAGTGK